MQLTGSAYYTYIDSVKFLMTICATDDLGLNKSSNFLGKQKQIYTKKYFVTHNNIQKIENNIALISRHKNTNSLIHDVQVLTITLLAPCWNAIDVQRRTIHTAAPKMP